jgi:hypothetical protein
MRVSLRYEFLAICGAVLPVIPVSTCLMFRGVEAWKLGREMSQFTTLGVTAWLWAVSYILASVVTIFRLDDDRELKWWELLIDAGNFVSSIVFAIKCATQQIDDTNPIPYSLRFLLWLAICLIPQLLVTHGARRARNVAGHLQRQLKAQQNKAAAKPRPVPKSKTVVNAESKTSDVKDEILA